MKSGYGRFADNVIKRYMAAWNKIDEQCAGYPDRCSREEELYAAWCKANPGDASVMDVLLAIEEKYLSTTQT